MAAKVGLVLLVGSLVLLAALDVLNGFLTSIVALGMAAALAELLRRPAIRHQFSDVDRQSDDDFVRHVLERTSTASRPEVIAARTLLARCVGVPRQRLRSDMTINDLDDRSRTWPRSWDTSDPVADFLEDWSGPTPELDEFQDVGHLIGVAVAQTAEERAPGST